MPKGKTMVVMATAYSFLETKINVPEGMTEDEVYEMVRADPDLAADMEEVGMGDWQWDSVTEVEFDPDVETYIEDEEDS